MQPVLAPGHDLLLGEEPLRSPENMLDSQREVLHQAVHSIPGNHLGDTYATATRAALGMRYRSNALAHEKTGEAWVNARVVGDALADWIETNGRRLSRIYITHGHGDHWLGLALRALSGGRYRHHDSF